MKQQLLDMILDGDYNSLDPRLPACIDYLLKNGAGRIWHKNGSFFEHLIGVWRILRLWELDPCIARSGLLHSIYGSSFGTPRFLNDRDPIKKLAGNECEEIIFKFCQIDRQGLEKKLITGAPIETLLSLPTAHDKSKALVVTPKELGIFILLSLADFLEQHTSWQESIWVKKIAPETLSEKEKKLLPKVASIHAHSLWPGSRAPFATRFNYLFALAFSLQQLENHIKIPAIFRPGYLGQGKSSQNSYGVSIENEISARNLYKQILREEEEGSNAGEMKIEKMMAKVAKVISLNPYIGEPYFLQAQLYLKEVDNQNRFRQAKNFASVGLKRLYDWGCAWDKRLSFSGWITWGRCLLDNDPSGIGK